MCQVFQKCFIELSDEEGGRTKEMQNEHMKQEEFRCCFGIMSQQNEKLGQDTECAKSGRCGAECKYVL